LPIGVSDFAEIITGNYTYVDKTLFIKELIEGEIKATLIPRPRRFGKTLNLSMLKCFFEKANSEDPSRDLFYGLSVSKYPEIMAHQGQYPVIFMTLKEVKQDSWQECYEDLKAIISEEYARHDYLLNSPALTAIQKKTVATVIDGEAADVAYRRSLKNLSLYLQKHYQRKVVILIDEYDTFIHEAYLKGYYDEAIKFARNFLGGGLKDNIHLERSVITGILRIAKESIFTGLNNFEVCTLLDQHYADKFGFLEVEVQELLVEHDLLHELDAVRAWYNGYASGNCHVYNPWSILQFIRNTGTFNTYWVNTSKNDLVKLLIGRSGTTFKEDFESLIAGKTLVVTLEESVVFSALEQRAAALWTFLIATGYLTFTRWWQEEGIVRAELAIPNIEVTALYKTIIMQWFADVVDLGSYQRMLQKLALGDVEEFREGFVNLVPRILSVFDVSGAEPEKFYHALVLGMFVSLEKTHEIKSNRESGYGRYDVILIPKECSRPGIIIEFKKISQLKKETLETAAQAALKQIAERDYAAELRVRGITRVIALAIVFQGKEVLVQEGA
jgi:hypothetical protein